jgi:tight adherence protein C
MFRRTALVLLSILALATTMTMPAAADDPVKLVVTQLDTSGFPDIRVSVRVTDAQGKAVTGLGPTDIEVSERGIRQLAQLELTTESAPVNLVLALDVSGSMTGQPLADAKAAIIAMIDAIGPNDRAAVVTFNQVARVDQGLTGDKAALTQATQRAAAGGNTAIYDAAAIGLDLLSPLAPSDRRAIVILTDGADTASSANRDEVAADAARAGIPIFAVGFGGAIDRPALQALADKSASGRAYVAPNAAELRAIYLGLVELVRTEYRIAYRSNATQIPEGASFDLALRLRRGGVIVGETTVAFGVPAGHANLPSADPATPGPAQVVPAPAGLVPSVPPLAIGVLGAIAAGVLLMALFELVRRAPGRQRRRLETFVHGLALTAPEHAKRRSIVQRLLVPGFRTVGRPFLLITPNALIESTRRRLQHAGEPLGLGPVELLGLQFGMALAGLIVGIIFATVSRFDDWRFASAIVVGALIGYVLPSIAIGWLGRRRKSAIRRALPGSLDMLALSVEAGLSLDGAFSQVAHRWHTPLSEELRSVLLEFQMGRDRRQALHDLGQRTGLPDVVRFTAAVVQADLLGVPLAGVLFEQAADIRLRRRQRAEDLARKAPVKMLFPMVVLIFPALFVVILGPAVPRLLAMFELAH